jgi:hypothetical protein
MPMKPRLHRRSKSRKSWKPLLLWGGGGLLVTLTVGFIGAKIWVQSYLHSEAFRQFVSARSSESLHAVGDFARFQMDGLSFFSESFQARGRSQAAFCDLRVDQVRAEMSTRRFFERVWLVDQITAQRVEVHLEGNRLESAEGSVAGATPQMPSSMPVSAPQNGGSFLADWLPNRVEIGSVSIRDANIFSDGFGVVRGTRVRLNPTSGDINGWEVSASGGHLDFPGMDSLDLTQVDLRCRPEVVFIQNATFRQSSGGKEDRTMGMLGSGGSLDVNGEVHPARSVDLRVKMAGLSVTPLLPEDWRLRLHGNLDGDIAVSGSIANKAVPGISGKLTLSKGQLEALPVLDQIAAFTRLQQFRRLALNQASAEFRQEAGVLKIEKLVLESAGLIRIEGGFTVARGMIDGDFQVGVMPSSLVWLPGSQEQVFNRTQGGYVWAPMHLSGPVDSPKEDLTKRLTDAAQGAILQAAPQKVIEAVKTGGSLIDGVLNLLGPTKK